MPPIAPSAVRYIKLGEHGIWEEECLEQDIIRTGLDSALPSTAAERLALCQAGRWDDLRQSFVAGGRNPGVATRFAKEMRLFFDDDGTTLWITFTAGRLYWGMLDTLPVEMHADGVTVVRHVEGGWRGTDLNGEPLRMDRLSGALTQLAAYQGTSCNVGAAGYAVRRINGQNTLEVERALAASRELCSSLVELMRLLRPREFELLVDLVFSTSGWRRVGEVGGGQATLDIELFLPSTQERAFVQVKSQTTPARLMEYITRLEERADLYSRMFYVYHSGDPGTLNDDRVTVIGPEQLAKLVLDAGLTGWLIEKTS